MATAGSPVFPWHDPGFELARGRSPRDAGPAGDGVDVLVVDDDHATRTSFGSVLRAAGFGADEAEDGFVALERLRSSTVHSLLLEVDLPRLDGLQLLDRLEHPPPVILMSDADYGTQIILRRTKVYMFIQKPIPSSYLLAAVARTLEEGRQRRADPFATAPAGLMTRSPLDLRARGGSQGDPPRPGGAWYEEKIEVRVEHGSANTESGRRLARR